VLECTTVPGAVRWPAIESPRMLAFFECALEAGGWGLEAGGRRQEAGGRGLEAGGWRIKLYQGQGT